MASRVNRLVSVLCVLALMVGMVPAALAVEEVAEAAPEVQVGTMPGLDEEVPETPVEDAGEPAALAEECCSASKPHLAGTVLKFPSQGSTHYYAASDGKTAISVKLQLEDDLIGLGVDKSSNLSNDKSNTNTNDGTFSWTTKATAGATGTLTLKQSKGVITLNFVDPNACVHEWGEGEVTKQPTCTEKGKQTYTCSKCKATEERDVDALGHDFSVDVAAVPATCYQSGSTGGKQCSRCDATDGVTVLKATGAHSYGADGKCTTPGCTAVDPNSCPHTNKVTVEHQDATCTKPGVVGGQYCQDCGDGKAAVEQTIPATGHDFSGGADKCRNCGMDKPADNMAAGGWFEAMYAELDGVKASDVTSVTYSGKMGGKLTGEDKQFLVRDKAKLASGNSGIRIDIPGISAGEYTIKVEASGVTYTSPKITVKAHDRSGYAHWNYTEGVGAYRDDGILKDNAIVLYVTEENKNTVELEGPDGVTVTGIGNILNSVGADNGSGVTSNGGKINTNGDILKKLANADIPLVVRFIGTVDGGSHGNPSQPGSDAIEGLTAYSSVDYGGTVGDNGFMARMKAAKNVTLEGIGDDAVIDGWGFHFMANSGDTEAGRGKNFEARNLTFRNSPEDSLGMEGQQAQKNPQSALSAPVLHCWVHNCAFYPANITKPAQSDKSEGDGACDFKRGEFFTMSYNYFQDCHKTNLIGANKDTVQFNLTFHHNYYVNCQARGPLARNANIHMYNNYYESQTDTVMSLRANAYVFSEYNWFERCHRPVAYKAEGTTGICKSYNDSFISCFENNDATKVTDKSQVVNSTNRYPSFELDKTLSYIPDEDYALDKSVLVAKANMDAYAGPMKSVLEMVEPEVPETGNLPAGRVPAEALDLTYTLNITKADIPALQEVAKKGINFFVGKSQDGELTLGGKASKTVGMDNIGYDIIFRVDKNVDITMQAPAGDSVAKTYTAQLYTLEGVSLLEGGGTVTDCPPGVYYIQSNGFDTSTISKGDLKFKEAKLTGLTITASADQTPPHTTHTWDAGKTTVDASCTKVGTKVYTCSVCGETKREEIPMLGHNMVAGACVDCGLLDGVLGGDPDAPEVPVTGLTLDVAGQTIGLLQGDSVKGTVTMAPANASDKSVTWESSNTGVATVSKAGIVTAKGPGAATITVTSNANSSATATFTVNVIAVTTNTYTFSAKSQSAKKENEAAAVGTYGTNDYFTLVGEDNLWRTKSKGTEAPMALQLKNNSKNGMTFTVAEGETADVKISFQSTSGSNSSAIALKGKNGFVAGKSGDLIAVGSGQSGGGSAVYEKLPAGTYTIVAPAAADVGDEVEVDVNRNTQLITISVTTTKAVEGEYVEVAGVSLDQKTAAVEVGSSVVLQATVTPGDASNPTVTWSSSDTSVATVVSGTVTGRKAGTATITAKAGSFSDTCVVTVTPATQTGATKVTGITVTDEQGRSSSSVTVDPDEAQTIALAAAVEPDDADHKTLTWTSDSAAKGVTVSPNGLVTVAATAQSCTAKITATATDGSGVKGTYTVTVTAAGESPSPSPSPRPRPSTTVVSTSPPPASVTLPFVDVVENTWYHDTVAKAFAMGLMKGTDATHFTPAQNTSRAMIATILYRLDGEKETNVKTAFDDVAAGQWYTEAIEWAADAGVVKGYDEDTFAPDDNITREQLAVMLYRYANPGKPAAGDAKLTDFVDAASVSDWATEAMEWCVKCGIITGKGANDLDPQGLATRAEAVTMLMRYVDLEK